MNEQAVTNAKDWSQETLNIIKDAMATLEAKEERKTLDELKNLHRDILTTEIAKLRKEVAMGFYGYESKRSLGDIVNLICSEYRVTVESINSKARKQEVAEARQVIFWMIRNKVVPNRMTLNAVGDFLGGKNHATVIHSCNAVDDRIRFEPGFKKEVQRWCSLLGAVTMYNEVEDKLILIGYETVSTEKTEQKEHATA